MRFSQWKLAVSALIAAAALTTVSGDLKSTCNTTVKTLNISDANSHEIFYLGKMGNGVYISCVAYEVTLINPTAQCKGTEQNYELDMQFFNPIKSPPSFSFGRMFRGSVQRAWMWGIGYFLYSFVTFRGLDGTLCPVNVRISIDATIALDANYNNVPWLTRTVPNVVTLKVPSTFQFDQVVRPSQDARVVALRNNHQCNELAQDSSPATASPQIVPTSETAFNWSTSFNFTGGYLLCVSPGGSPHWLEGAAIEVYEN